MTDLKPQETEALATMGTSFAASRLGQVAQIMSEEGTVTQHQGMVDCAAVCMRRGHDLDEDVRLLIRVVLFQYANSRGINVMALPQPPTH